MNIRPEMQLLLLCLRPRWHADAEAQALALAGGGPDWDYVLEQASRHCIGALLYTRLQGLGANTVPADILARLQARFDGNFKRNLFLTGELVRLLARFDAQRIPVVSYKGPVLASYYENLGAREFGDLDLLVRRQDVQRADELLRTYGFQPYMFKPCPQQDRALPFARRFHFEMSYAREGADTSVDLHWALMPGFFALPAVAKSIWDRLHPVTVAGKAISTLAPEDTLLFACVHGTKHIWERLGWVRDVAMLIERCPALDWTAVIERAAQFDMSRALALGLRLASEELGASVPPAVQAQIAGAGVDSLLASIRRQWFENADLYSGVIASCAFYVRSREGFADAVRCCAERIFQPTMAEWETVALPRALYSLYYLLRPARLVGKYVWGE